MRSRENSWAWSNMEQARKTRAEDFVLEILKGEDFL